VESSTALGHESVIRDLCLKLSIGLPQLKGLRIKFRREHGASWEAELAAYLQRIWRERRDELRLLANQAGSYHPQQYVSSTSVALPEEPEAVPEDYQRELSKRSRASFEVLRAEQIRREARNSRLTRLRELDHRAEREGVDITSELSRIDQAIADAERKVASVAA
jgi:hypothetical protein